MNEKSQIKRLPTKWNELAELALYELKRLVVIVVCSTSGINELGIMFVRCYVLLYKL